MACAGRRFASGVGLIVVICLPGSVIAEEAAPDTANATQVSVNSLRHPAMMSYRKAYEMLDKVQAATNGQLDLIVRVMPKEPTTSPADVKVWLVGPDIDRLIPINPDGIIDIPLDRAAYNANAELVSNQKKGALLIDFKLQPRFSETPIRYHSVVEMIALARDARDKLLPWYLRVLFPNISRIDFCSPSREASVSVTAEDGIMLRPADHIEKDQHGALHCVRFGRAEPGLGPAALITPESNMVPQFGG